MEVDQCGELYRQQRYLDPVTDGQATLSIGAIAIQPGNTDPTKTVILTATGLADNSGDSYFGFGMLRSTDAGIRGA